MTIRFIGPLLCSGLLVLAVTPGVYAQSSVHINNDGLGQAGRANAVPRVMNNASRQVGNGADIGATEITVKPKPGADNQNPRPQDRFTVKGSKSNTSNRPGGGGGRPADGGGGFAR
jgi:hypothetical protein